MSLLASSHPNLTCFTILLLSTVIGATLEVDKEVLVSLKAYLLKTNRVNQGDYAQWNESEPSPCNWTGITCQGDRVTGIDLHDSYVSCKFFGNFSGLSRLSHLDLSRNTIHGSLPSDLNQCNNLRYLNLSHNIISGEMRLPGLTRLEVLDVTVNRFSGGIGVNFPGICNNLVTLNVSMNNFTGDVIGFLVNCPKIEFVDVSANRFNGTIRSGVSRFREFSASENCLSGRLWPGTFREGCRLGVFDVSKNNLTGELPESVLNCGNLTSLNLWGNEFSGRIPARIGTLQKLEGLFLGSNRFDRDVPVELLNCTNLVFLDLSKNNFSGDVQPVFGRFTQVKFLVLHGNSYTGGVDSSGILTLPMVERLDLSYNNFTGRLPIGVVAMPRLKYLTLAFNRFSGDIPAEYGNMASLQALDLSYNQLTGKIPATVGNLTSLLWLMLANNYLVGGIPAEIGNCRSLLWLNLANNKLIGGIPPEISSIGRDPSLTFETNQRDDRITAGSGECLSMRRWIPADYPPFSFVYTIMTRKSCRSTWDSLLKGRGIVPVCTNSSSRHRTLMTSGYVILTGNQLSGRIPPEIGRLANFSLIHVNNNELSGELPPEIARLPLNVLNVSHNRLSGNIPSEIGHIKCLQNLDLSYNNFSGIFPTSFDQLSELSKFNVSYNPFLTGTIPTTGQMTTFDKDSFLGNPLIVLSARSNGNRSTGIIPHDHDKGGDKIRQRRIVVFFVFLGLCVAFFVSGVLSLTIYLVVRPPPSDPNAILPLEDHQSTQCRAKVIPSLSSSSASSSRIKVFQLNDTTFTYTDIIAATRKFSDDTVIGTGGYGTVYKGTLPDGRVVAVKKLRREGSESEMEFKSEMKALPWPHPNLVTLLGWCLNGPEKVLVYEYVEGGSLDDIITDTTKFRWKQRLEVAIGVARALVFLHHECFPAVVHRDVKASNVLLDGEGRAKVTDFGLSRVVSPEGSHVSTVVAGTVGYVAPEYAQEWRATTKGDVYSFGVLAMELATGRRAVEAREEECLVEWARRVGWSGWRRRVEVEKMCELVGVGMKCTSESPHARPNMKEVLTMLVNISKDFDREFRGLTS